MSFLPLRNKFLRFFSPNQSTKIETQIGVSFFWKKSRDTENGDNSHSGILCASMDINSSIVYIHTTNTHSCPFLNLTGKIRTKEAILLDVWRKYSSTKEKFDWILSTKSLQWIYQKSKRSVKLSLAKTKVQTCEKNLGWQNMCCRYMLLAL